MEKDARDPHSVGMELTQGGQAEHFHAEDLDQAEHPRKTDALDPQTVGRELRQDELFLAEMGWDDDVEGCQAEHQAEHQDNPEAEDRVYSRESFYRDDAL